MKLIFFSLTLNTTLCKIKIKIIKYSKSFLNVNSFFSFLGTNLPVGLLGGGMGVRCGMEEIIWWATGVNILCLLGYLLLLKMSDSARCCCDEFST